MPKKTYGDEPDDPIGWEADNFDNLSRRPAHQFAHLHRLASEQVSKGDEEDP